MRKTFLSITTLMFLSCFNIYSQDIDNNTQYKTDTIPANAVITDTYKTRTALMQKGEVLRVQPVRYEGDLSILKNAESVNSKFKLNGAAFIDKESVNTAHDKFINAFNTKITKRYKKPLKLTTNESPITIEFNVYSVYDSNGEIHGLAKIFDADNNLVAIIHATGYGKTSPELSTSFIIAAEHAGTYLADQIAKNIGWGK